MAIAGVIKVAVKKLLELSRDILVRDDADRYF